MTRIHAFNDDALGDLDAVALAAEIKSGNLSQKEAVEAAIARAEQVNPALNAIQVEAFDRAREQVVSGGIFAGVPSFVKDNSDVTGLPSCQGSEAFKPHPAKKNTPNAEQYLSHGFVVLGKTTMPEFGLTASTEYAGKPPTRNPWNTDHSVGASSGGSAAMVAAGVVPIAHANDGGGSVRIPAACAGLVGMKPTRARLPDMPGVRQLPVNLVGEGAVTRTVRDTAHYFAAADAFRPNPKLPRIGLVEGPSDRRLRIGLVTVDILDRPVHAETGAVLTSAADIFAGLGHEVVEMRLKAGPEFIADFKVYWALFAILMSASFQASHGRSFNPRKLDPFTKGLASFATRNPHRIPGAIRRLRGATKLYDEHFADVDVVLTPVLSHPAPLIGEHAPDQPFEQLFSKLVDYVGFTPLNNIGGGPGISLPHGMFSAGIPGSVQLSAARGDERTLLELAYELEAASPFPRITDRDTDTDTVNQPQPAKRPRRRTPTKG